MASSKVERCVITTVHDINSSASHDEHVHHAGAALSACPVQGAKAVVISAGRQEHEHSAQATVKISI